MGETIVGLVASTRTPVMSGGTNARRTLPPLLVMEAFAGTVTVVSLNWRPSGSVSPVTTEYAKRRVVVPEPDT